MSKVKFAAKHEYESLANYKVMQNVFKAKKIDKVRGNAFQVPRFDWLRYQSIGILIYHLYQ